MYQSRRGEPNYKNIAIFLSIIFASVIGIVSCNKTEPKVYDNILTERVEVKYQDSGVDTLLIQRNEAYPYKLNKGDLISCKETFEKKPGYATGYVVCCGVRSFMVLGKEIN